MVPLRPDPRYPTTGRVGYNTHCSCDIPSVRPAKKLPARECCAVRKTIRDYKTVSVYNLSFELIFIRILRSRVRCRVSGVGSVARAHTPTRPREQRGGERAGDPHHTSASTTHPLRGHGPHATRSPLDHALDGACALARPHNPRPPSTSIPRHPSVFPAFSQYGRGANWIDSSQLPSSSRPPVPQSSRPLLGRALQPLGIIDHHGAFARRPGEARR